MPPIPDEDWNIRAYWGDLLELCENLLHRKSFEHKP